MMSVISYVIEPSFFRVFRAFRAFRGLPNVINRGRHRIHETTPKKLTPVDYPYLSFIKSEPMT